MSFTPDYLGEFHFGLLSFLGTICSLLAFYTFTG